MRTLHHSFRLKLFFAVFFTALCVSTRFRVSVMAENATYYERRDEYAITTGVKYQKIRQVTEMGMRDIHVLEVGISDSNIELRPVESKKTYSLKEPLTEFLRDAGAIAGVNGDFFGMAGNFAASFGPVISGGRLISATTGINQGDYEFAAFFVSNDNNPFVAFMRTTLDFYNDGKKNLLAFSFNKITDMLRPVVITRAAMADTANVDKRFAGLYKIVVTDGKIAYIAKKGETVPVPENGYVIVMNSNTADNCLANFHVGEQARLEINAGVDFDSVKTSIGGGGLILKNGELSNEGEIIAGRQPRTAVGISKDKKTVYLVAVDGRTHSVGATHDEMAEIMLKTGAYNAMHLDGGGSTTMAVSYDAGGDFTVVNRVSDGAQRKIINGLGVFNNAPFGEIKRLVASVNQNNVVYAKAGAVIDVYGTDDYLRRIDINRDEVSLSANDPNGFFAQGLFYPQSLGEITLNAEYESFKASIVLSCRELKELRPEKTLITVMEGDEIPLKFTGIDGTGDETPVTSSVLYSVVPPSAGFVKDGVFYPKTPCDGYIECRLASVACYVGFHIGGDITALDNFSGERDIAFKGTDEKNVTGSAVFANGKDGIGARLTYNLPADEGTVAAYLEYKTPIKIEKAPLALRIGAVGDNSGLWLRGRVKDAKGETYLFDFAREINWAGLKTLNAYLSPGMKYPITLEALYAVKVASLNDVSGEIYFYDLCAVYERQGVNLLLPESNKYADPLRVDLSGAISNESYDITVLGRVKPFGEVKNASYKTKLTDEIAKNAKRVIYLGQTDLPADIGVPVYIKNESYAHNSDEKVCLIQMHAAGGGITKADTAQWGAFTNDIGQSGKKNAIIFMDGNPLYFSSWYETRLFCDALTDLTKSGVNIFVVSAQGFDTTVQLIGGVRYINLGSYWLENGTENKNFRFLRFRVSDAVMKFDLY